MNNVSINAFTGNQKRRIDFHREGNPDGFNSLLSELEYEYPTPDLIGREANIFSLYYNPDNMPEEYFEVGFDLYCIKLDNNTGDMKRKAYKQGHYSDIRPDFYVSGTGFFLDDENRVTLYHNLEGFGLTDYLSLNDLFTINVPYMGTTYKDGKVIYETIYVKE